MILCVRCPQKKRYVWLSPHLDAPILSGVCYRRVVLNRTIYNYLRPFKFCLWAILLFGGYWKTRSQPKLIWSNVRLWLEISCVVCVGEKEETSFHLFFGCRFTWLVQSLCDAWLGLKSVDSFNPHFHILQFNLCNAPNYVNLVLENVGIEVVSEFWCVRNNVIFKGGVMDHLETFSLALLKVWSWIFSKIPFVCFSYSDWCLEPLICLNSIQVWFLACWFLVLGFLVLEQFSQYFVGWSIS